MWFISNHFSFYYSIVFLSIFVLILCQDLEEQKFSANDYVDDFDAVTNEQNFVENSERLFGFKEHNHIDETLNINNDNDDSATYIILKKLSAIYKYAIRPLEEAYKFSDLNQHVINDGEIFALPRVTFIGPWSTGKSSMINYLLGVENSTASLASGAQPTTTDFTVLSYGTEYKTVEGMVLAMDSSYSLLEKFGQNFLERLQGIEMPNSLLKKVNFVDTPGIIENRKQTERGYPFVEICKWFLNHSDLIIFVLDPTKLDVGVELETLIGHLKGHETKVRIVLNKADTITPQELLRVYGVLLWNLSPLINVTEPPQIYVSSFWSKKFSSLSQANIPLFISEEIMLLKTIHEVISNRLENKIAFVRQYAVHVRNHALLVDQYLQALHKHKSFFQDASEVALNIVNNSDEYRVFQNVLINSDVSKQDLHSPQSYLNFFKLHSMTSFAPLSQYCGYISSCLLDNINYAIQYELPLLLDEVHTVQGKTCQTNGLCE